MNVTQRPASAGASDAALMRRFQVHDDAEAFALLYDRHAAKAQRVARAVCQREGAAEDAVQEAFISIWRGRRTYRQRQEGFGAWAMTIVRNRAIDIARRDALQERCRDVAAGPEYRPAARDVADEVVARDDARHLRKLLAALPDEQSEVIAMAYYGGLKHTEIAACLELPAGTVKSRVRLGLQKLSRSLDSSGNRP